MVVIILGLVPGLTWLMSLGCLVPGTKRIECVEENCGAASVKLSPEEMEELEAAVPHHEVMAVAYRQHVITQRRGRKSRF
jgi:diketogulonate reductase-like aldo/keto reductase